MTLSILERRRELGLLRVSTVVGMVIESVLIAALGQRDAARHRLITAIGLSDAAIDVTCFDAFVGDRAHGSAFVKTR
jgi:hypothetical protein